MSAINEIKGNPERIFAIGDIHGCLRETNILLEYLIKEQGLSENDHIVFIGDYIDRGPDSKGVISALLQFKKEYPNSTFLKGNHEDMLLDFLGMKGNSGADFLHNGGDTFLESYGLSYRMPPEEIRREIPQEHLIFIMSLYTRAESSKHSFIHAGIDPRVPVSNQDENSLLWIREEFISHKHDYGKTIVFGHTPFNDIFIDLPYKIGIDTGLVYKNALTCVEVNKGATYQIGYAENKVYASTVTKKMRSTKPEELKGARGEYNR